MYECLLAKNFYGQSYIIIGENTNVYQNKILKYKQHFSIFQMLPDTTVAIVLIGVVICITILLKLYGFCTTVYNRCQARDNPGAEGRDTEAYGGGGIMGDLAYCIACKTCCRSKNGHGIVE